MGTKLGKVCELWNFFRNIFMVRCRMKNDKSYIRGECVNLHRKTLWEKTPIR